MRPVAVRPLVGDEVVLRKAFGLPPQGHLHFARGVAAHGDAAIAVVAALAGAQVDAAANVVQAIARVVGAAHHFDVVQLQRKDHVNEALVAAVDVAGDAVDQHLDAVDIALAVEGAERGLARLGAHAGFGELDAGQLTQQFPALHHVLVFDFVCAQDVYRGEQTGGRQGAAAARVHGHFAQHDDGIARSVGGGVQAGKGGCQRKRQHFGREQHRKTPGARGPQAMNRKSQKRPLAAQCSEAVRAGAGSAPAAWVAGAQESSGGHRGRGARCGREPRGRGMGHSHCEWARCAAASNGQCRTAVRRGGCQVLAKQVQTHQTGVCRVVAFGGARLAGCRSCVSGPLLSLLHQVRGRCHAAVLAQVAQLVRPRQHRRAAQGQPQQPHETVNPGATHGRR